MQIIHVVRLYCPHGGMERYVWELTHQMRDLGHEVIVLCQACQIEKPEGITIYELGLMSKRPRWLSYLRFDKKIVNWLHKNPHPNAVIHSHERLSCHHVTTFHGPPFANVLQKPWWKLISARIWIQLYLEQRELKVAHFIIPNSTIIKQLLTGYYPELAHKLRLPVIPGVANLKHKEFCAIPDGSGVIGFVGREWKRKGLHLAVNVVENLRITRPNLEFQVIGPEINEIQHLFTNWNAGYKLIGWSDMQHYSDFDVLFHPAKSEPYGMVISEAMAAGVPVVISDACGAAAQVTHKSGSILPLTATIQDWSNALDAQLKRTEPVPPFVRSWNEAAQECLKIYSDYFESKKP